MYIAKPSKNANWKKIDDCYPIRSSDFYKMYKYSDDKM